MRKDHTDIIMVLDRSGSMDAVRTDTIGGVNRFIDDQQKVPGEARFTLVQFDDKYEPLLNAVPIKDAKPLTEATYVPRGSTALYGAIGRTVEDAGRRLAAMPESERPEKVVCVIVTDGQENNSQHNEWSRMFDAAKIKSMIETQQNAYKWQFVFIGANQDAILAAQGIGIDTSNAINYTANKVGTEKLYASASSNLRAFRTSAKADMSWDAKQRKEQEAAK